MLLPELHLADWRPTKDTLHLYCQILGKVRLATRPPRNHWWNAPLYVDVHGLTTRRLHHEGATFELAIDFRDDALVVRSGDGRRESLSLVGVPVATFDAEVHRLLRDLGVDVEILEEPFGVPMTTPFPKDTEHAAWDHDAVGRFGHILDWSDTVLEEFSGWFNGKTSPVRALLLARVRSRRHAVLRTAERQCERRPRDTRGVLARGHLVRLLAGQRHHDLRCRLLFSYTAPSHRDYESCRSPWARGFPPALRPPWRSFPTKKFGPPAIPGGRCSPSARAPMKPARVSRTGT